MKFTLNITDWQALAPGLSEAQQWQAWSRQPWAIDPAAPLAKLSELPMMTARRLSSGSNWLLNASDNATPPSARRCLYTSSWRTERNYRIVHAQQPNGAFSDGLRALRTQLFRG
ncbi:MAG: beta-ketoacyl synthase chain length factor [Escherichia sp.]